MEPISFSQHGTLPELYNTSNKLATRFLEREVRNIDSEHFVFPESGVKKPAEPKKTQGPPLPNASVPVATDKPKQIRRRRRRKR